MYSRYTPTEDGSYRRQSVMDAEAQPPQPETQIRPDAPASVRPPAPPEDTAPHRAAAHPPTPLRALLRRFLPQQMDTGDLLILLIFLLILIDGEEDNRTVLITLAIFLFLQ